MQEGKLLYMAVPRLAGPFPFLMLDPTSLKVSARRAASIRGSAATGEAVVLETMVPIDLIVCGSVAVNPHGSASGREEATPTSSSPW